MSVASMAPPFEVRRAGQKLPSRIVNHGLEGSGKTGFAAQFPKPFFLLSKLETGLETLIDSGQIPETDHFPPLHTWSDTLKALEYLQQGGEPGIKTLVLDVLNGFEQLYLDDVIRTEFGGDAEKLYGFGRSKDYQHLGWMRFLSRLETIRESRRIGIVLLAHTGANKFKNPEGHDYDRYSPRMNQQVWDRTFAWADIALFFNFGAVGVKEKGMLKAKGTDTGLRTMYTTRTAAWDAKNRHNLPPEIPMGDTAAEAFAAFSGAMRESRKASAPAPVAAPVIPNESVTVAKTETAASN